MSLFNNNSMPSLYSNPQPTTSAFGGGNFFGSTNNTNNSSALNNLKTPTKGPVPNQELVQNINQNGTFDINFNGVTIKNESGNPKDNASSVFKCITSLPELSLSLEEYRSGDYQLKRMNKRYDPNYAKFKISQGNNSFGGNNKGFFSNNNPNAVGGNFLNGNQLSFGDKSVSGSNNTTTISSSIFNLNPPNNASITGPSTTLFSNNNLGGNNLSGGLFSNNSGSNLFANSNNRSMGITNSGNNPTPGAGLFNIGTTSGGFPSSTTTGLFPTMTSNTGPTSTSLGGLNTGTGGFFNNPNGGLFSTPSNMTGNNFLSNKPTANTTSSMFDNNSFLFNKPNTQSTSFLSGPSDNNKHTTMLSFQNKPSSTLFPTSTTTTPSLFVPSSTTTSTSASTPSLFNTSSTLFPNPTPAAPQPPSGFLFSNLLANPTTTPGNANVLPQSTPIPSFNIMKQMSSLGKSSIVDIVNNQRIIQDFILELEEKKEDEESKILQSYSSTHNSSYRAANSAYFSSRPRVGYNPRYLGQRPASSVKATTYISRNTIINNWNEDNSKVNDSNAKLNQTTVVKRKKLIDDQVAFNQDLFEIDKRFKADFQIRRTNDENSANQVYSKAQPKKKTQFSDLFAKKPKENSPQKRSVHLSESDRSETSEKSQRVSSLEEKKNNPTPKTNTRSIPVTFTIEGDPYTMTFEVNMNNEVEKLKEAIIERFNKQFMSQISIKTILLMIPNQLLDDGKKLSNYNFIDSTAIKAEISYEFASKEAEKKFKENRIRLSHHYKDRLAPESLLPIMNREDYTTSPNYLLLCRMTTDELKQVEHFKVYNDYGEIEFLEKVNLTGLNLDKIIDIKKYYVSIYDNGKDLPVKGKGLNVKRRFTIKQMSLNRDQLASIKNYIREQKGEFISYDEINLELKFQHE